MRAKKHKIEFKKTVSLTVSERDVSVLAVVRRLESNETGASDGALEISMRDFGALLGVCPATAKRAVSSCKAAGWIVEVRKGRRNVGCYSTTQDGRDVLAATEGILRQRDEREQARMTEAMSTMVEKRAAPRKH